MKTLIWPALLVVIALVVPSYPEESLGAFELSDRDADRALVGGTVTPLTQCGPGTAACVIAPGIVGDCAAATNLWNCWTGRMCSSCTVAGLITVCGPLPVGYGGTPSCDDQYNTGGATPCGTQSEAGCLGAWIPGTLLFTCVCPAGPYPPTPNKCGQTNCKTIF